LTAEERSGFDVTKGTGRESGRKREDFPLDSFKSNLKQKVSDATLFTINSIVFSIEKNKEEVINNFNCFYAPAQEAICIMVESDFKYRNFSREIVMDLMEFAKKLEIKNLLLFVDKKNTDYGNYNYFNC